MPCYTALHGRQGTALSSKGTLSIWSRRQGTFQPHEATDHMAAAQSRHLKLRYTRLLQARTRYKAGADDSIVMTVNHVTRWLKSSELKSSTI